MIQDIVREIIFSTIRKSHIYYISRLDIFVDRIGEISLYRININK